MTIIKERPLLVANWLLLCALMVFAMANIGAITRLTESGLSITEWKPITGAIPPTSAEDWQKEFDLYQATPEYKKKNMGMELDEFKKIYFWEWVHRFFGRAIGMVFAIPFLAFWVAGWIPRGYTAKFFLVLCVGGMQAFVGWFMVQSGLIDRPSVSHYRLALHLSVALLLYSLLIWLSLSIRARAVTARPYSGRRPSWLLCGHAVLALLLLAITIVWGAFVAGLDAGLIYNEFPTMGDNHLMPTEMWHMTPNWLNLFENHAAVQFTHRWLAMASVLMILALSTHALLADVHGRAFPALALMVLVQAGLGITTLISGINIHLAVMHQAGAMILLGLMVVCLHTLFRRSRSA